MGIFLTALALIVVGCASVATIEGRAQQVRAGEEVIGVEAVSFGFRPNRIFASAGSRLQFKVKNSSSIPHNLTVKAPDGKLMLSMDLPAGKTRQRPSDLQTAGEYVIYCDKPGHQAFGMKGVVVAR